MAKGNADAVTVKEVRDLETMLDCIQIQRDAWGFADIECVPTHVYVAQNKSGGNLLATYVKGQKKPVGFAFLMAAFGENDQKENTMQMIAVEPEYQNFDISRAIGQKIIELAHQNHVKKISWTYDPLQGANANTYFNKFGAVARTHILDMYGKLSGDKNSGLTTDRFNAEIEIGSPREERAFKVYKAEFDPEIKIVNQVTERDGFEVIEDIVFVPDSSVYVQIPSDFSFMKNKNLALAIEWRNKTREIFEEYMTNRGYAAVEFVSKKEGAKIKNYYLLRKNHG
jgi:chorismate synthase